MRVLVCGSRTWDRHGPIYYAIGTLPRESVVIHGAAPGADRIAAQWAHYFNHHVEAYPADWKRHGKAAGPIRNQRMLDEGKPDKVLAFWDGTSRGTKDMIDRARQAGVPVEVVTP